MCSGHRCDTRTERIFYELVGIIRFWHHDERTLRGLARPDGAILSSFRVADFFLSSLNLRPLYFCCKCSPDIRIEVWVCVAETSSPDSGVTISRYAARRPRLCAHTPFAVGLFGPFVDLAARHHRIHNNTTLLLQRAPTPRRQRHTPPYTPPATLRPPRCLYHTSPPTYLRLELPALPSENFLPATKSLATYTSIIHLQTSTTAPPPLLSPLPSPRSATETRLLPRPLPPP